MEENEVQGGGFTLHCADGSNISVTEVSALAVDSEQWKQCFTEVIDDGQGFRGYVTSLDQLSALILNYEDSTNSKYSAVTTKFKNFGETGLKQNPHPRFSSATDTDQAGVLPFDGIPFVFLNAKRWDCQYGPDRHIKDKAKSKAESVRKNAERATPRKLTTKVRDARKISCPQGIVAKEVVKFPKFKVDLTAKSQECQRRRSSKNVKAAIEQGDQGERRIYVSLPSLNGHNHIVGDVVSVCEEIIQGQIEMFRYTTDIYRGIQVCSKDITCDTIEEFGTRLQENIYQWEQDGVRGVWFKIRLVDATLVGEIAKHGFRFHHAQSDYVMMVRWLPTNEPDKLPSFANHYIGVGGLVFNSFGQMLVIKELYAEPGNRLWKMPGGSVDTGEHLSEAVVREVSEETGIRTEFKSVLCFRHMTTFRHGQSDFYFVCLLEAQNQEITPCPTEIADAKWMDIDDFLSSNEVGSLNKEIIRMYQENKYAIHTEPFDKYEIYSVQE